MRREIVDAVHGFFFARERRATDDHLVQMVRREAEAAAWFIRLTTMFSVSGNFASIGLSAFFLLRHWDQCAGCDRPLRWWLLVQSILQIGQLPIRLVILWVVRDAHLEARMKAITDSQAWRAAKITSLALYGWLILGVVWWMHSSSCDTCPGVVIVSAAVIALSVARALVAVGAFMLLFPAVEVDPLLPAIPPKNEAASQIDIDALEIVCAPEKGTEDAVESCAVCLADFEHDDLIRRLPCRHLFHMCCIDKWLQRNKRCPLCMHPIDEMPVVELQPAAMPCRRSNACVAGRDACD
jgi:hypothetical protein